MIWSLLKKTKHNNFVKDFNKYLNPPIQAFTVLLGLCSYSYTGFEPYGGTSGSVPKLSFYNTKK